MTITVGSGLLSLNAGASIAASVYAIQRTYRTFPIFQDLATRIDTCIQFSQGPIANNVVEWGLFQCATTAAPLDGVLFRVATTGNFVCVVNYNGTENSQDTGIVLVQNTRYEFSILVDTNQAYFYINNNLVVTLPVPTAGTTSTAVPTEPLTFRNYNNASGTTTAQIMKVLSATVTLLDGGAGRPWPHAMAGMGLNAIQNTMSGTTTGQTANFATAAAPASATVQVVTTAGYATLGGQWQFAAVAGSETESPLFSYLNPAPTAAVLGRVLYITGIYIDAINTGAAVGASPTIIQWGLGAGSTTLTTAGTVDASGAKVARRVALGFHTWAAAAAIGASAAPGPLNVQFNSPIVVNPGEYLFVIMKTIAPSLATASQILRGTCFINGYFE
jgi:hypothetical protein